MNHAVSLRSGLASASRFVLVFALTSCAAVQTREAAPEATLAASAAADQAIRPLVRRWMLASPAERLALDRTLSGLTERFRGDALLAYADVLRAWDALERGDRAGALVLARPKLDGPAGTVRDLATLVVGAVERRSGHPKDALARLLPLLHKFVDPPATALLDEELVRACSATREWKTALRLMDIWLFESPPGDREVIISSIVRLFTTFPESVLVVDLRLRLQRAFASNREESRLAAALTQHLANVAVAKQDVRLARLLLDNAGSLLGGAGEAVARLAGDRARGRVTARTVGVLLALASPALTRRSADVLTGMAFGLGVGDTDARLVARDDAGDPAHIEKALSELAAEGAAVIVAGLDARHSQVALEFARAQDLPILLLTEDSQSAPPMYGKAAFRMGERAERSVGLLAAELRAEGAKVVAGLGVSLSGFSNGESFSGSPSGIGVEASCSPLPAAEVLRSERVDGLVAVDGAHCGPEVFDLGRALHAPVAVGLGAMVGVRLPQGTRVAAAGVFPVPEDRSTADPRLLGWFESGRPTPTWWMGLGRDAAVLAVVAVRDLAEAASDSDVRARRREATAVLAQVQADLWTTEAHGFDATRTLPRAITVVRANGSGRTP